METDKNPQNLGKAFKRKHKRDRKKSQYMES